MTRSSRLNRPERRSTLSSLQVIKFLLEVTRVLASTRLARLGALSVPRLKKHLVRARGVMPSVYHGQPPIGPLHRQQLLLLQAVWMKTVHTESLMRMAQRAPLVGPRGFLVRSMRNFAGRSPHAAHYAPDPPCTMLFVR